MQVFGEKDPSLSSLFRSIILFGKNSATYKFTLAKSLLDLADNQNKEFVSLDELAEPFVKHMLQHLEQNEKQTTSRSSKFLEACKAYQAGKLSYEDLLLATRKYGFDVVLKKFHNVGGQSLPLHFFREGKKGKSKGIYITDHLFRLLEQKNAHNFKHEVEARWRLVETSWSLDIPPSLLQVHYDQENQHFFIKRSSTKRVSVTSTRDALNGYQKGKCFYCFRDISVDPKMDELADVDHFFPHGVPRQATNYRQTDSLCN